MDIKIIPAYDHSQEIRELFSEYTEMLISGDPAFKEYLEIKNYDDELEHLEDKYGMPAGCLYLAYCDGKTAGCIGLKKLDEDNCEMKRLYVRPEFRGRKIGGLLIQKIIDDAKTIGYKHMLLDTLPFLGNAVHMYKKWGFYEIGCYNNSPMESSIYMRLDLDDEVLSVNGKEYRILKLLGKGKGGYSYLAESDQVKEMCRLLYAADTNIDYFPTNFIMQDGVLYYVDYECNKYMEEWNFENWGMKYWSKTPEFLKYAEEHSSVVAEFTTTAQTKKFI